MAGRNLTLLTDLYELTMMQGYFKERMPTKPSFSMHFTAATHAITVIPSAPVWSR